MRCLFPIAAVALLLSGVLSSLLGADGASPHIILILVDDMGYGDLGCYNPESKIKTPNIDRLAAEGMRFTDMHASGPLCHISRYGLMTGQYPFRGEPEKWAKQATIKPDQTTVPSLLKDRGYQTAMVGKWHLGFDERGYDQPLSGGPVDRGFDQFFGIRASTDIPPYFYIRNDQAVEPPTNQIDANNSEGWSPIQGAFWREGGIAPNLTLSDVLPRFTDEAIEIIESHGSSESEGPLFLYLAYPAPHTPWLPSPEFAGKSDAGMYGDFAMMVDSEVGRVLGALDEAGMSDQSLILLSSDNGPVWYEEDVERLDHDSSGGLRGMKSDAWEAGHRMPFLARWPGEVDAGSVTDQTLSFVDVLATLADLTGPSLKPKPDVDSLSFAGVLTGDQPEEEPVRDSLVLQSGGKMMTMRSGPWKLIDGLGSGGFSEPRKLKPEKGGPEGQLFDLESDPAELHNVYAQHPDIVARLKAEMDAIVAGD